MSNIGRVLRNMIDSLLPSPLSRVMRAKAAPRSATFTERFAYRVRTDRKFGTALFVVTCSGGSILAYIAYRNLLSEVPVSKRKQFVSITPKLEVQIGRAAQKAYLGKFKKQVLADGDARTVRIRRILSNLIRSAPDLLIGERYEWELHVIEAKPANAFVVPGGKVIVFTGLLEMLKTDDELAVILSHELAHAVARHGAEKLSIMQVPALLLFMMQRYFGTSRTIDSMKKFMFELPYSRMHESEADFIGLHILSRTCAYDPQAAIRVWQQFLTSGGAAQMEFMSTHPSHQTRLDNMKRWMPDAIQLHQQTCPAGTKSTMTKLVNFLGFGAAAAAAAHGSSVVHR